MLTTASQFASARKSPADECKAAGGEWLSTHKFKDYYGDCEKDLSILYPITITGVAVILGVIAIVYILSKKSKEK